ncbi:hypothetical protein J2127_000941 [Methanococcus voltae]|uniref:hypothetical protein n=1 Tax=Methanococcus voltae TaxID=2188 RepID=UPI001AE57925|nr:hypothetical protein [Methanococcus voltae]MBP2143773.1 hypothetical protein [Methanococcus voltae]
MKKIILVTLICIIAFVSGAMISANILWNVFGENLDENFKDISPPYTVGSGELYVSTIPGDSLDVEIKYALINISEEDPDSVAYDAQGNIHIMNKSVYEKLNKMLKKDDKELNWVLVPDIEYSKNSSAHHIIYRIYTYEDISNLNLSKQQMEKIFEIYQFVSLSDEEINQLNLSSEQKEYLNNTVQKNLNPQTQNHNAKGYGNTKMNNQYSN